MREIPWRCRLASAPAAKRALRRRNESIAKANKTTEQEGRDYYMIVVGVHPPSASDSTYICFHRGGYGEARPLSFA